MPDHTRPPVRSLPPTPLGIRGESLVIGRWSLVVGRWSFLICCCRWVLGGGLTCPAPTTPPQNPWYAFDPAHWNVYEHGLGYLSVYEMGAGRGQMTERELPNGKVNGWGVILLQFITT